MDAIMRVYRFIGINRCLTCMQDLHWPAQEIAARDKVSLTCSLKNGKQTNGGHRTNRGLWIGLRSMRLPSLTGRLQFSDSLPRFQVRCCFLSVVYCLQLLIFVKLVYDCGRLPLLVQNIVRSPLHDTGLSQVMTVRNLNCQRDNRGLVEGYNSNVINIRRSDQKVAVD